VAVIDVANFLTIIECASERQDIFGLQMFEVSWTIDEHGWIFIFL
jgi:hypothetical protein